MRRIVDRHSRRIARADGSRRAQFCVIPRSCGNVRYGGIKAIGKRLGVDEIGIKEKDIILSINRQPVNSFEDVKKIQAKLKPGDAVAFRVLRKLPGTTRGQFEWTPAHLSGTLPKE